MRVALSPRAGVDLEGIRDYLVARNPQAAELVREAIDAALQNLEAFPFAGRNRPELDARSLGVPSYPYTIYYRVEGDEVVIVHVRDDRRRPLRRL